MFLDLLYALGAISRDFKWCFFVFKLFSLVIIVSLGSRFVNSGKLHLIFLLKVKFTKHKMCYFKGTIQ